MSDNVPYDEPPAVFIDIPLIPSVSRVLESSLLYLFINYTQVGYVVIGSGCMLFVENKGIIRFIWHRVATLTTVCTLVDSGQYNSLRLYHPIIVL